MLGLATVLIPCGRIASQGSGGAVSLNSSRRTKKKADFFFFFTLSSNAYMLSLKNSFVSLKASICSYNMTLC